VEGIVPHTNPPLTDPLGPLLVELPSMRPVDSFSSYHLPLHAFIRHFIGMTTRSPHYTDIMVVTPLDVVIAPMAHITTTSTSPLG